MCAGAALKLQGCRVTELRSQVEQQPSSLSFGIYNVDSSTRPAAEVG